MQFSGTGTAVSAATFLHRDHQGSIVAHSNHQGTLTQRLTYDAYGIPATTNNGRFQYTGQLAFKELGLYYYKARIYNPKLGRFLQTDPIGYEDDTNLYAYTGNDPVNYTDPMGEARHPKDKSGVAVANLLARGIVAVTEPGSPTNTYAQRVVDSTQRQMTGTRSQPAPIHGNPQTTSRNGAPTTHASTSQRVAETESQRPDAQRVHQNQTVNTITNGEVKSNIRPDVATVRTDGKIDVTEVLSRNQTQRQMEEKITNALSSRCGTITCIKQD